MTVKALCLANAYRGTGADLQWTLWDQNRMVEWIHLNTSGATISAPSNQPAAQMLEALIGYVDGLEAEDFGIVSYSGHGSHVPDRSGDEADHRDETWVGEDLVNLTDDTLNGVLAKARCPIVVYSDSCFSGTVTRAMLERSAFLGGEVTRRYLPPETPRPDLPVMGRIGAATGTSPLLLLSGCNDAQYSYETSNEPEGGVFTTTLLACYEPGMTFKSLHKAIRKVLPNATFPQSPRLYPSRSRMRGWPVFP